MAFPSRAWEREQIIVNYPDSVVYKEDSAVTTPIEAPVELSPTNQAILDAITQESLGRSALLASLGYTQRTGNFKKALGKLISAHLIEMTIPDKPNSRLQKYRLTDEGKCLLKSMQE